jgi:hypothetical protein
VPPVFGILPRLTGLDVVHCFGRTKPKNVEISIAIRVPHPCLSLEKLEQAGRERRRPRSAPTKAASEKELGRAGLRGVAAPAITNLQNKPIWSGSACGAALWRRAVLCRQQPERKKKALDGLEESLGERLRRHRAAALARRI